MSDSTPQADARLAAIERLVVRLATALDDVGGRIYRDINPDSSYAPDLSEQLAGVLESFTEYYRKQAEVLDDPAVRDILSRAAKR